MLRTSVVDEMNAELAAALTGREDALLVLQELCANNTFVSRAGKDMFRYHHLFLDFLRNMAKDCNMNLSAVYKAAAQYYLEAKQYLPARTYAVRSDDEEIILKVMYQFQQYSSPSLDEYIAYSKLFNRDTLPEKICDRFPFLYTALMETAWMSGDTKGAEYAWDKLWKHIPKVALKFPQFLETVILETAVDYRKSMTKFIAGFSLLPPIVKPNKQYAVASLTIQLPFAQRCIRDFSELADKGMIEKMERSFALLLKDLWQAAKLCLQSGILLEQNKTEQALPLALQAKETAAGIQSAELNFTAYSHLAASYMAAGNNALLNKTLTEMEQYIEHSGARYLEHNFLALKTKFHLCDADKKAAETWLEHYFVSDEERIPLYKIFQYFTTVRAYIVLNQGDRAVDLIRRLIQFAKDYRRPLDLAEAQTLKACLDWASDSRAEAAAGLEEVLSELQRRKFIRIVADEGEAVVPILKRIAASVSVENYTGKLDRAFVTEVLLAAHDVSKRHRGITANMKKSGRPVKLSKQQKKMLELLTKGYKNEEIARIAGIALPTVKGHLMQVYEKLGVHNAMDALLKARELGLM
jgi:LuxR family maltose regulon positive regulatory protein